MVTYLSIMLSYITDDLAVTMVTSTVRSLMSPTYPQIDL